MSERVAAVAATTYQPPHGVVLPALMQSQAANGQQSGALQPLSFPAPIAFGIGAAGLLGFGAFGIDYMHKHLRSQPTVLVPFDPLDDTKRHYLPVQRRGDSRCYQHVAEMMTNGQLQYGDFPRAFETSLVEATMKRYRIPGATKKTSPPNRMFADEPAIRRAAEKTIDTALHDGSKPGLSARKLVDLLNHQVDILKSHLPANVSDDYRAQFLRKFDLHVTPHGRNLAEYRPEELFSYPDVKRFGVLYFHKLEAARTPHCEHQQAASHHVMLVHHEHAWRIADSLKGASGEDEYDRPLIDGAATREGALEALQAFAMRRYGTTHHVNMSIIAQVR